MIILQKKIGVVPLLGSKVTYEDPDRHELRKAMILSRTSKASGVNKYWLNIKDLGDALMKSVGFENINGWKNFNEEVLLCKNETFDIAEAKRKELENWQTTRFRQ